MSRPDVGGREPLTYCRIMFKRFQNFGKHVFSDHFSGPGIAIGRVHVSGQELLN